MLRLVSTLCRWTPLQLSGRTGALLISLLVLPTAVVADIDLKANDKPGLIWNQSGLPAVFPLQVKTTGEQNYLMTLIDKEADKAVIAAHVVGGAFFKILVPPGTFTVRFSALESGNTNGDSSVVDNDRDVFELSDPLVFRTLGLSTKAGHVIDLTDNSGDLITRVKVKPQFICQTAATEFSGSDAYHRLYQRRSYRYADGFLLPVEDIRFRHRSIFDRHMSTALGWPDYLHLDYSGFSVRSSYCD